MSQAPPVDNTDMDPTTPAAGPQPSLAPASGVTPPDKWYVDECRCVADRGDRLEHAQGKWQKNGTPHHKYTNAKVERANGVISDTLRAYANGRKDDRDLHLMLAEFAINNAASTLGDGLTPFFIDRGAHPRLPLSPPQPSPTADSPAGDSPALYAERMRRLETTVRELLAAAQAERKAKLDAGRVDTVFRVGDRVLLRTKELLDAADIGKLRPRWDGPFTVTACPSPNAYTLSLPSKMRCSPTVNVDRLKPFFARSGAPPPPGPVSDAGQEGEHEVELLLNCKTVRGVTRYLVRWRGRGPRHCRRLVVAPG